MTSHAARRGCRAARAARSLFTVWTLTARVALGLKSFDSRTAWRMSSRLVCLPGLVPDGEAPQGHGNAGDDPETVRHHATVARAIRPELRGFRNPSAQYRLGARPGVASDHRLLRCVRVARAA